MTWRRNSGLSVAAVMLASAAVSAQDVVAPPGQAAAVELARTKPYAERVATERPVVRLSVSEIVTRTLQNNLDLVLERYNQLLARSRAEGARGYYDPALSLSASSGRTVSPGTPDHGASAIPSDTTEVLSFGPVLRENLAGGASVSAGAAALRAETSSRTSTVNPVYNTTVFVSATQPLLRGFIYTAARRQIDNAELDTTLSDAGYRLKATQVLQQVLNQYWELAFAIESYEARRQSKELVLVQYESTRLRVQAGLLTPVAVTAARAEIASRERDLLQAEVQIISAENTLKLLLADDPASPLWEAALLPADRPQPDEATPTLEQALALAASRRPELAQVRLQMSQNRNDRQFYRWERLPVVNLTGSLVGAGRAGTVFSSFSGTRAPDPDNLIFGGFNRAFRQSFGYEFSAWSIGLNVQVPLRNRSAGATLNQAVIVQQRLAAQLTRTQQSVNVEVSAALRTIAIQRKSLEAARLTTALFQEQLDGQTARYESGFSSDFELLRYQRDMVDAQGRELRALIDLQQGMIQLRRATDTLLDAGQVPLVSPGR